MALTLTRGRTQLARIYFRLLDAAGASAVLLRDVRASERLVVLNLHQISPVPNPYWSPLHPTLFAELLSFIAPRFEVTTFAGLATREGRKPPLVLSFDDGYHDFLEHAAPLLDRHGMRANQNVIGACALSGQPTTILLLSDFLRAAPRSLLHELRLPGFAARLAGDGDEERMRFGLALFAHMKMRPRSETAPDWETLERLFARLDFARSRMMTIEEIREAARAGHEIGSHSFEHDSMAVESDDFFVRDFARAEELFRDRLALPLTIYAFPNGSWRPAHLDLLAARGVAHTLLVDEGYSAIGNRVHSRFNHYSRSPAETHLRACGYSSARGLLRSAWTSATSMLGARP